VGELSARNNQALAEKKMYKEAKPPRRDQQNDDRQATDSLTSGSIRRKNGGVLLSGQVRSAEPPAAEHRAAGATRGSDDVRINGPTWACSSTVESVERASIRW